MNVLLQRQAATQAAVERFKGKPLAYGKDDCVRLAVYVLRRMGHRPQMGKAGTYKTALGALRALKRYGYDALPDALDGLGLARIAPAAALTGDLIMLPAGEPFGGAITVAVGNGRVLGWHDAIETCEILHPLEYAGAWRV